MCTFSSRTCLLLVFVPFDRCNAHRRKKNMFINLVNCSSIHSFNIHSQCRRVHGKITYEWYTDDIRVHTSDIRMTYEYIQATYGWHTSTCEWHTSTYEWHMDDIRLHTSDIRMTLYTYEWYSDDMRVHTSDIRMAYEYVRVAYEWHTCIREWHTDEMRFERKINFLKPFW